MNKTTPFLLGAFILFNPLPYSTTAKEICFYSALVFSVLLIVFNGKHFVFRSPLTVPFAMFFLWSCMTVFTSLSVENSINDIVFHLIKHLVFFFLVINFFNRANALTILAWIIVAAGFLLSLAIIFDSWGLLVADPTQRLGLGDREPTVGQMALSLAFSSLMATYLFRKEKNKSMRMLLLVGHLLSVAVLLALQTRSAILALLVGYVLMFIRNKKSMVIMGSAFVLLVLISPVRHRLTEAAYGDRIACGLLTLEIIKDYPVFGVGYGQSIIGKDNVIQSDRYVTKLPEELRQFTVNCTNPHNMLLSIAARTGVIGLILFLYIIFVFYYNNLKLYIKNTDAPSRDSVLLLLSVFTMFLVNGQFQVVFAEVTEVILFTVLAMFSIFWLQDDKRN